MAYTGQNKQGGMAMNLSSGRLGTLLPLLAMSLAAPAVLAGAEQCTALRTSGRFANTTVNNAQFIAADAARGSPAFCEITGVVKANPRSSITVVYRLPENWNGRLLGLGGGGWAGNIVLATAAPALARGYATAQTDGGHVSPNGADTAWVAGNPDALTDFSHRAVHLMTTTGKAVVAQYYGKSATRHYFQGCSTGGRMALMEAQRYPEDYDAIIAGAPVYTLLTQTSPIIRDRIFKAPGAAIPAPLMQRINAAALAACDKLDGLEDGIVTDPRRCTWDPAALQCAAGVSGEQCLTPPQVKALRQAYSLTPGDAGRVGNYPLTRGGELTWQNFVPTTPGPRNAMSGSLGELRLPIFGKADYDATQFDPARDQSKVHATAFAREYEAANADLGPFLKRGGKLLMWHGFDDGGPSPFATIDYFDRVQKTNGRDAAVRLFIAPAVGHCRGGPGTDDFDALGELEKWDASQQAPMQIPARNARSGIERPLCPWPALPYYRGSGDAKSAASFECRVN
jgi:feruloyl esterase